jgi:hypothetical protein
MVRVFASHCISRSRIALIGTRIRYS